MFCIETRPIQDVIEGDMEIEIRMYEVTLIVCTWHSLNRLLNQWSNCNNMPHHS